MTPLQKIKHAILIRSGLDTKDHLEVTLENIDQLYEKYSYGCGEDIITDAAIDLRSSGVDTGMPPEYSRNYESKSVAAKMPDGSWVGWTYWYGIGKHGGSWMDDAYDLNCVEEEKLVVVRTFTKP